MPGLAGRIGCPCSTARPSASLRSPHAGLEQSGLEGLVAGEVHAGLVACGEFTLQTRRVPRVDGWEHQQRIGREPACHREDEKGPEHRRTCEPAPGEAGESEEQPGGEAWRWRRWRCGHLVSSSLGSMRGRSVARRLDEGRSAEAPPVARTDGRRCGETDPLRTRPSTDVSRTGAGWCWGGQLTGGRDAAWPI